VSLLLLFSATKAVSNGGEGVHGVTVDTTNSGYGGSNAWTSVTVGTGATCVYDNTAVAKGSSAIRISTAGTASQVFTTWLGPLPSHGRDFGRLYFRFASGGAARTLMRSRSGGTQVARIALSAADKLELRNGANSTVATGTATLSAGTWYRIEWDVQPGTGTDATLYLYAGDSTTPLETITANSTYSSGSTVDEHAFGQVVSTASLPSLWLDGMQANSTGLPGPAVGVAYVETQSSSNAAGATVTTSATIPAGATGFATLSGVPTSATLAPASGWTVANAVQAQSTSFQAESYAATAVAASTAYAFSQGASTRYTVTATVVAGAQTTLGGTSQAVRAAANNHTTPALAVKAGSLLIATFTARVFSADVPSMNTWTLDTAAIAAGWVRQADAVGADGSTNTRHMVATLAVAADATVSCTAALASAEPAIVNIAEHRAATTTTQQAAASLTAAPTLTAGATGTAAAAATLNASPTLTAAGTAQTTAAATLASTPTLTAAATPERPAAATLTAAPTLTAGGTTTAAAAVTMSATPTLTAAATRAQPAAATLTATPTLATAADRTVPAAAALTATPTLAATASGANDATATLTATPTLDAAATPVRPATAALVAAPTLTAAAVQTAGGAVLLVAAPTLTAGATGLAPAAVALVASPVLNANGARLVPAAVLLTASPVLVAGGTTAPGDAVVLLVAAPTLTATATVVAVTVVPAAYARTGYTATRHRPGTARTYARPGVTTARR
jgi:hypothetical protein